MFLETCHILHQTKEIRILPLYQVPRRDLISYDFFFFIFIFYFLAVLGLRFCARAFSSCGKRGPLFIAVRRPLTAAASLAAEHRLQTHRLSRCGSRAQLLRGMWDLPGPGLEPVSPALAGRLPTTAPPGKPFIRFLILRQEHQITKSSFKSKFKELKSSST